MGPGGIEDCDNAQNCVKVCPKGTPLTESLAAVNGQVMLHAVKNILRGKGLREDRKACLCSRMLFSVPLCVKFLQ